MLLHCKNDHHFAESDKSKGSEDLGKANQTKEGIAAGISESLQNLKFSPPGSSVYTKACRKIHS